MTSPSTPLKLHPNYRITFESGFIIECFRQRKPTTLAKSWQDTEGAYTIEKIAPKCSVTTTDNYSLMEIVNLLEDTSFITRNYAALFDKDNHPTVIDVICDTEELKLLLTNNLGSRNYAYTNFHIG